MAAIDQGVDELQAFCALVEGVNHVLEQAEPDLTSIGHGLEEAEADLRDQLTGLRAALDGLQQETAALEAQATAAAGALAAEAHAAQQAALPGLEEQAGEAQAHDHETWTGALTALQADGDDVATSGFAPLTAAA